MMTKKRRNKPPNTRKAKCCCWCNFSDSNQTWDEADINIMKCKKYNNEIVMETDMCDDYEDYKEETNE
jgi:hypothetical protein